jgi:hypothetical protein
MKYMVSWSIDQDNWLPILKKWAKMTAKERADVGRGVKMIGRWHDTASRSGVAIMQAKDIRDLYRYIGQWNPFMEIDVSPVLDDAESARLAKETVRFHGV